MDYKARLLARIEYLQAELAALAALVRLDAGPAVPQPKAIEPAPEPEPAPVVMEPVPHEEEDVLPPEPEVAPMPTAKPAVVRRRKPAVDLASLTIDPVRAAEILNVARQTVDRRLKDGRTTVPGSPYNVSGGATRARWRWASEDDVRQWWSAVK